MNLQEFIATIQEPDPEQSRGQWFMNNLYKARPDLYNFIYRTDLDCFYNDFAIGQALNFIKSNWGKDK